MSTSPLRLFRIGRLALLVALAGILGACAQPTPTPPVSGQIGPQLPPNGVNTPAVVAQVAQPSPQSQPAPRPPSGEQNGPTPLTILYTNDTRGYVDPCG